jgi:hypothetical protein
MKHAKIKKLLSSYVDGELSSAQQKCVENHVASCKTCRAMLADFQRLHAVAAEPVFKKNPFFAQRVLAELKSRKREGFWQVFDLIPRPVIVTGLVLSVVTLTVFAFPQSKTSSDLYTSEVALFYGDQAEQTMVTNDQALAIAININEVVNGE